MSNISSSWQCDCWLEGHIYVSSTLSFQSSYTDILSSLSQLFISFFSTFLLWFRKSSFYQIPWMLIILIIGRQKEKERSKEAKDEKRKEDKLRKWRKRRRWSRGWRRLKSRIKTRIRSGRRSGRRRNKWGERYVQPWFYNPNIIFLK